MMEEEIKGDLARLRNYIYQGENKKIRRLLTGHPTRLNYFLDQHQFDACAFATKFKQKKVLHVLHNYGFPLDGHRQTQSITALIIAIRRSDFPFVRTLIELGCDVNCAVRSYAIIPLLEAYRMYRKTQDNIFLFESAKKIFQYLLESGASPNVYNVHYMRLVHLTVIDGEFDLLQILLNHGAHVNVITATHRKNLLHLVCDRTIEQSVETLLRITRILIQLGCDINHRDDCFETPLMCTLHHGGHLPLAHELIVEGTRLDSKNNFGNTYLTRAVHYALYDHARMALYAGAPCRAWQCSFAYINRNYNQQSTTTNQMSLMDAIRNYEQFVSILERYLFQPRQLKDLARLFIRQNLPWPLSQSTARLDAYLPMTLIRYLMLDEMKTMLNIVF